MLVWLRLVKLAAVVVMFSGAIGAVTADDLALRRRFALRLGAPGFGLAWVTGFVLVHHTSTSLLEPWVLGAMALSFVSLQAMLFLASREGRGGRVVATAVLAPLFLALALMVLRPG